LVKFDLTQIAPGTEIDKATMKMWVEGQPRTGTADANVYHASKEWNEMEATWFKANSSDWWNDEGGDRDNAIVSTCPIPNNATNKWEEWDVTSSIQEFINNPESNLGFHFFMSVTMVTVEYTSSESNNKQNRPMLILETATAINANKQSIVNDQIRLTKMAGSYQLFVPFAGASSVKVYDVKGTQLAQFTTSQTAKWHALPDGLKPGVHILRINNNGKSFVKKLWLVK